MIIWRGLGILVVIIGVGAVALMQVAANAIGGQGTYETNRWLFSVGLLLAAAIIFPLGRYLNSRGGRVMIDKQSVQEMTLRREHSLFFIRMEYWAVLLAVAAVVAAIWR